MNDLATILQLLGQQPGQQQNFTQPNASIQASPYIGASGSGGESNLGKVLASGLGMAGKAGGAAGMGGMAGLAAM